MREREAVSVSTVGGSSLLTIFAVLCLVVFALLGLSTVQADGRLADASADAVRAYYEADCAAEAILSRLRQGECPAGVTRNGDRYEYTCPVSDTQILQVEVQVTGSDFTVLRWQTRPVGDWQPEDGLNVWDGGVNEET